MTRVGTGRGCCPWRIALAASSASANHVCTVSSSTPGRKRSAIATSGLGAVCAGAWAAQQPAH
eukprot:5091672-Prymnesium_polylepis.1